MNAAKSTFLPSFLVDSPPLPLRQTSALDGLRGLGAWCVVNYHILSAFETFVNYGYGLTPEDGHRDPYCAHHNEDFSHNRRFHQLPIIRLIYSGSAPVCVFFVLSGFVLSYRPWKLARQNPSSSIPNAELYTALSSAAFRRFFRLFLPLIVTTFITMLLIQLGAWDYPGQVAQDRTIVSGESEFHQRRLDTLGAALLHWTNMLRQMLDFGNWDEYYPSYDVHLWTIPMEYRSSLLLFLLILVAARMQYIYRLFLFLSLIVYSYTVTRWVSVLFFAGSLIAETSLMYNVRYPDVKERDGEYGPIPSCSDSRTVTGIDEDCNTNFREKEYWRRLFTSTARTILRTLIILLSLYFLSAPDYCIERTPGYRLLGSMIPPGDERDWRFYPSLGAILLVAVVSHSPRDIILCRILESRPVQYLGRISYSLYLVHGPIMHGLGYRVFPALWLMTGREGWHYFLGLGIGWVVVFLVVIYVADRFMVLVDEQSVKVGRWIEGLLVVG